MSRAWPNRGWLRPAQPALPLKLVFHIQWGVVLLPPRGGSGILMVACDRRLATGTRSKRGTSVVERYLFPEVSLDKRRIRRKRVTIMCSA